MNAATSDPRSAETRGRLVAAGLELFGRHGFDAVTTRRLAEAAGVNQAAIPYHFGGKQGVYLAVAEHVAARTGARVGPLREAVRARLAETPGRAAAGALLLETTLALARIAFEPAHRGVWLILLAREQFRPSAAFERLYTEVSGPLHGMLGELVGALVGAPADAPETILLAHAYLGQLIGFLVARAGLQRRLGWPDRPGAEEVAAALAAIERFSRYAIAGMGGPGASTVPPSATARRA
jgi:AcrR family transcriptional regulator